MVSDLLIIGPTRAYLVQMGAWSVVIDSNDPGLVHDEGYGKSVANTWQLTPLEVQVDEPVLGEASLLDVKRKRRSKTVGRREPAS